MDCIQVVMAIQDVFDQKSVAWLDTREDGLAQNNPKAVLLRIILLCLLLK